MSEAVFRKKTIGNILKVSVTNLMKLLAGVLVGFILPKIIGVTDYGYYKTFTLYASYTGLLHFGFADGIYLKCGGKKYDDLNKESFRAYSTFIILLETVITALFGLASLFFVPGELKFMFLCLAAFTLSSNIVYYYQIISQITERFGELSLRNLIQSMLTILSILCLLGFYLLRNEPLSYRIYTIIYVSITVLLTFWYIWTYRDITFGKRDNSVFKSKELFVFFKIGFPLLVANLCQSLILSIDRQFVNIFYDTDTYAVYAFAYNMLSLITTALAAISTVLYPILKKSSEESLKTVYSWLIGIISIIVSACMLAFFPLCLFVDWFLPKYLGSLTIFRIILPGLIVSSSITLIMHNYYKAINKEGLFFIKSICILILSIAANLIAYFVFKTTEAISIASVLVMFAWYVITEEYFVRRYKIKWKKNLAYIVLMVSAFYATSFIGEWRFAMLIYLYSFTGITMLFYRKDLRGIRNNILGKHKV